jgi:hypothetical protein
LQLRICLQPALKLGYSVLVILLHDLELPDDPELAFKVLPFLHF